AGARCLSRRRRPVRTSPSSSVVLVASDTLPAHARSELTPSRVALLGAPQQKAIAQRTKRDWAKQIQQLVDVRSPDAERLVLALDPLTPPPPAALDDPFPPAEAQRLTDQLEIPYPPSTAVGSTSPRSC